MVKVLDSLNSSDTTKQHYTVRFCEYKSNIIYDKNLTKKRKLSLFRKKWVTFLPRFRFFFDSKF